MPGVSDSPRLSPRGAVLSTARPRRCGCPGRLAGQRRSPRSRNTLTQAAVAGDGRLSFSSVWMALALERAGGPRNLAGGPCRSPLRVIRRLRGDGPPRGGGGGALASDGAGHRRRCRRQSVRSGGPQPYRHGQAVEDGRPAVLRPCARASRILVERLGGDDHGRPGRLRPSPYSGYGEAGAGLICSRLAWPSIGIGQTKKLEGGAVRPASWSAAEGEAGGRSSGARAGG
jgi:hypothetical protein